MAAPLLWDLCGESTVRPAAWVTTQRERLEVFQRALAVFCDSTPQTDRYARQEQIEKLTPEQEDLLGKLSGEYYSNPFPNWDDVLDYVKAHSAEFDLAPSGG